MTSISAASGSAPIAPPIDTSLGKPTQDQVRQEQENNANQDSPYPNLSNGDLQNLTFDQHNTLDKYPNMNYQQVVDAHGKEFPNISPREVQDLNSEQVDRLIKYPTMTYQDVLNGHGVKGGDNFIW
ncbi:hypothetical protein LUW10_13085 [Pseudomonas veronii]|jgi:hypothetical protein|uniref:hypothetical protein n=1 Tax=Pseudomonas TaxID=286 RepID=UPI00186631F5|nr:MULTISPECIES: hypothetical protein [Pseudomonas]UHH32685.1 hypothetical protein LUW10_13085 [Pseudomonas veronii]